ncbi:MAG TPA: hypothetical protein VGJ71_04705 [Candidatus Limnocylindrales bacterium]|jgi:hypothetical protein
MTRRVAGLVATVAMVATACGILPPDYTPHVSNSSTLRLTVFVNGTAMGELAPESQVDYAPARLPPLPWTVEARMMGGRAIASMTVQDGSLQDHRALDGTGSYSSVGSRVTLTCGQVWLWVGEPGTGGPMAEGVPGDCDP